MATRVNQCARPGNLSAIRSQTRVAGQIQPVGNPNNSFLRNSELAEVFCSARKNRHNPCRSTSEKPFQTAQRSSNGIIRGQPAELNDGQWPEVFDLKNKWSLFRDRNPIRAKGR